MIQFTVPSLITCICLSPFFSCFPYVFVPLPIFYFKSFIVPYPASKGQTKIIFIFRESSVDLSMEFGIVFSVFFRLCDTLLIGYRSSCISFPFCFFLCYLIEYFYVV